MWCAKDKSLTYDEAKTDASKAKKDIKLVSVEMLDCLLLLYCYTITRLYKPSAGSCQTCHK